MPDRFRLEETPSPHYAARTAVNVANSDGTLLLVRGKECFERSRGTKLTRRICDTKGKPWWAADPRNPTHVERVCEWIAKFQIRTLNVAGPRESTNPGIQEETREFLSRVFASLLRETREELGASPLLDLSQTAKPSSGET